MCQKKKTKMGAEWLLCRGGLICMEKTLFDGHYKDLLLDVLLYQKLLVRPTCKRAACGADSREGVNRYRSGC